MVERRRRLKTIILSVALIIFLAVIGAGVFLFLQSRGVDHYFIAGNAKLDKALARLDKTLDDLAQVRVDKDPADLGRAARRIGRSLPPARADLAAAEKDFRRMRKIAFTPWEAKTAGLLFAGAREAQAGTRDLDSGLGRLGAIAKTLVKVEQAADRYNKAFILTNAAITAGNDNKFTEAKQNAADADRLFSEAQKLLTEANKVMPDKNLAALIPALSKGRQWATQAGKMADAGAANQIAVYNELVKESNQLSEEAAGIGRAQVLANPRTWFNDKINGINDSMAGHFDKADKLREKALRLWEKNT